MAADNKNVQIIPAKVEVKIESRAEYKDSPAPENSPKLDKKGSYLKGYELTGGEASKNRIKKSLSGRYYDTKEKLPYDYSKDKTSLGKMYTDTDKYFRYSLNIEDFEDPTFLGFNLKFDSENSPLFNYGDWPTQAGTELTTPPPKKPTKSERILNHIATKNGTQTELLREETTSEKIAREANNAKIIVANGNMEASPITFIRKYANIPEIKNREPIYSNFIQNLDTIFGRTLENSWEKSYYIESISGLDKLSSKMVKYGTDLITIQLTEDISLKSSYLAELYNNLTYSYKNQRYLIPENCMRFDLMIEITDIRIFRLLSQLEDGVKKSTINNINPSIQIKNIGEV